MASALTLDEFKLRSLMPPQDVDGLESQFPGFVLARLAINTSWVYARLAKRYATPFAAPIPEVVLSWVASLTDLDCYLRRGFNPSAEQDALIKTRADESKAELKEAADSKDGLFDLPLREDNASSAISKQAPLAQGYASPYSYLDDIANALNGGGR